MSETEKPKAEDYIDLSKVDKVEDFAPAPVEDKVEVDETPVAPAVPDKYQGKTLEDLIKMHQDSQDHIAKQATTIGEVRSLADDLIQRQLSIPVPDDTTGTDDDDLNILIDPEGEVNRIIANHPSIKQAEQNNLTVAQERSTAKLLSKHGDFMEVTASKGFQDWVGGSKVRMELFQKAGKEFNADVGIELLDTYKALHPQQEVKELSKETDQAIRDGATPSGGGYSKPASSKGKLLKRSELMTMMIKDPRKYDRLGPEIERAYREGRVVD